MDKQHNYSTRTRLNNVSYIWSNISRRFISFEKSGLRVAIAAPKDSSFEHCSIGDGSLEQCCVVWIPIRTDLDPDAQLEVIEG
jgi:hypothetical protein